MEPTINDVCALCKKPEILYVNGLKWCEPCGFLSKAREFAEAQTNHGYTYPYPRPSVTMDCVIFYGAYVALIKRGKEPFKGCWALPGGFLEMNERIEDGAIREVFEETNLVLGNVFPVGVFDAPDRDPRGRTIGHAFWTIIPMGTGTGLRAGDDAAVAEWVPVDLIGKDYKLAFDHEQIVRKAIELRDKMIYGSEYADRF